MKSTAWVMVNHNGGGETLASVRSLLGDMDEQHRIYLVDNGSSDGSGPRAARLSRRVELLAHQENRPFAAATNRGIERALEEGYEAVGIINPDVRVQPGMTARLAGPPSSEGEEFEAVSPVILYEKPASSIWYAGGRVLWPFAWTLHRGAGRPLSHAYRYAGETGYLTGCCWLAGREVWERVGLLDPSYGMYAEDVDWSVRARSSGVRLRVDPGALLVHRVSQSSGGGRSSFKMTYRTLAGRLFFRRHTPPAWRPLQKVLAPAAARAYVLWLRWKEGSEPAEAFRRAWSVELGERVPWPPSRQTTAS